MKLCGIKGRNWVNEKGSSSKSCGDLMTQMVAGGAERTTEQPACYLRAMAAEPPESSWIDMLAGLWRSYESWVENTVVPAAVAGRELLSNWAEAARPAVEGLARFAVEFREAYDEGVPAVWQPLTSCSS
jgi:hypothetical protein